jgi:tetratricopeptide (TPR) repeat protein
VFAGTGKPFAMAAFSELARVLDRHAEQWTAMHLDLCSSRSSAPALPGDVSVLRSACLDQRLAELRAFIGVVAAASPDVVQRAPQAVNELADPTSCADVTALLGPARLPSDPAERAQVEALREPLAEAQALHRLGRYPEALQAARRLVDRARAAHYRPLEAELMLLLGNAAYDSGEYAETAPALQAAVLAAEAGRADKVEVRALIELMYYQGIVEAHYDQALRDHPPRVTAVLERLGGDAELEGRLHVAIAWLSMGADRYDALERESKLALDTLERRFGASDIALSQALSVRIWAAVFRSDGVDAAELARRLLAIRTRVFGNDHPYVSDAYHLLGLALERTPQFGDARAAHERAIAIDERALGPSHPLMADLYATIANYEMEDGRLSASLDHHRAAVAITEATSGRQSRQYAEARVWMAQTLGELGRDDEALAMLREASAVLAPTLGNDSIAMSEQRQIMAVVLMHVGRYAEAREQAEASQAVLDRLLQPHHPWSVSRYLVRGQIELAGGRARAALDYLDQARAVANGNDGSVARMLADVDFETARALAALGSAPARAGALARAARDRYARYPELAARRQQIANWLAHH